MDSFKFNSLNYQDNTSLVESQNKIIDDLIKDNKIITQDQANYATFRAKESQRQLQQLGNIIAGVPKLKAAIEKAKEKKESDKALKSIEIESAQKINRTANYSTDSWGRDYDDEHFGIDPKKVVDKENDSASINQQVNSIISDPYASPAVKAAAQKASIRGSEFKQISNNTSKFATDQAFKLSTIFGGEGEGYRTIAEKGQFQEFDAANRNFLVEIVGQDWFKQLSRKNQLLFYDKYQNNLTNLKNQAARAWIAKSDTIYINTRRNDLLENLQIDPGKAIESYIFQNEYFGNTKDTGAALLQLQDDLEYLETQGYITAFIGDGVTYSKILSGIVTERSSGKSKEIIDLNNKLTTWIESRRLSLSTRESQAEETKAKLKLKEDIEATEVRFEDWSKANPNASMEEEEEWRQKEYVGLLDRNGKRFPHGHEEYQGYLTGLTRFDSPDHSITLTRLLNDHSKGAPLDDAMYQNLPRYWKNQFQQSIGGTDGQEGSSATGTSGSLTFKSMFNPIAEKGPWESFVSKKLGETKVDAVKSLDWYWIRDQGKEDWVAKFKELKTKGPVEDAQEAAFDYIVNNFDRYAKTPRPKGFDPTFMEAVTAGRADIIPRLRGKSQDDKLAVLNQDSFWGGEEAPYRELVNWSKGYGKFPDYYRQVDDNLFKDMTPREIALHRMKIHQAREEKSEAVDNAVKAIYKGVELDNKLFNSLPLDTSRLLTNHNTASRTYRAEVQEKDNPEVYEPLKINDDPNAYTPINPYSDHVPERNLSEMSLNDVFREARDKRLSNLGLYGLTPKNILDVLSKEEEINGFLDTTFDEELQTELKRRLARLAANKGNQTGALVENPNPLPNLIPEDVITLTEAFGPQDWSSITPPVLQMHLKELQEQQLPR